MTFEEWYAINIMSRDSVEVGSDTLTYKAMKRAYEAGYKEGASRGRSLNEF